MRALSYVACAVAGVSLSLQPLEVTAAVSESAQLPDWDAAKPKPRPAQLPDWDAAKPKPKSKPSKPRKPKNPGETAASPPPEAPPERPTDAPAETADAALAEATTEPASAASDDTPPPAEARPIAEEARVEGPESAVDAGGSREALKLARRETIAGGVLLGLGVVGFGILGAGVATKRRAEDDNPIDEDTLARGNTMLAAGAVAGTIGVIMGLALLGEGIKDRRAARPGALSRVQVAPTFGGLILRGHF